MEKNLVGRLREHRLQEAVLAERERCAKIVMRFACKGNCMACNGCHKAKEIVAAIRSGK